LVNLGNWRQFLEDHVTRGGRILLGSDKLLGTAKGGEGAYFLKLRPGEKQSFATDSSAGGFFGLEWLAVPITLKIVGNWCSSRGFTQSKHFR